MERIQNEHIKVVFHNIGNGITEPKLAMTNENEMVVIKTNNGPEGTLVLFNEYLCYRLANLLGIPMPDSGVCIIDNDTEVYDKCVSERQLGYGFYSTYLNKSVVLVESIVPLINNKDDFYKILLFDHIIFNTDRNPGNLLVQYYKNSVILWAIDHSHVFINQAIWDARCLTTAMREKDYFSSKILEENNELYSMFFRNISVGEKILCNYRNSFVDIITEDKLYDIVEEIPEEWLPAKDDIDALICYILYRIAHFDDICVTILKYLGK
ncbi:HipA family kinase [Butyrivibrio sp. NC2007]|uniref:HipA family kinase n=1 Tax=Butyrivibrio sp. NC2007 TaxID=1280683 RepID=UPI0003B6811C|nr:HipA family kinase [Butyrivibrio sp. NC2007]